MKSGLTCRHVDLWSADELLQFHEQEGRPRIHCVEKSERESLSHTSVRDMRRCAGKHQLACRGRSIGSRDWISGSALISQPLSYFALPDRQYFRFSTFVIRCSCDLRSYCRYLYSRAHHLGAWSIKASSNGMHCCTQHRIELPFQREICKCGPLGTHWTYRLSNDSPWVRSVTCECTGKPQMPNCDR